MPKRRYLPKQKKKIKPLNPTVSPVGSELNLDLNIVSAKNLNVGNLQGLSSPTHPHYFTNELKDDDPLKKKSDVSRGTSAHSRHERSSAKKESDAMSDESEELVFPHTPRTTLLPPNMVHLPSEDCAKY